MSVNKFRRIFIRHRVSLLINGFKIENGEGACAEWENAYFTL